MVKAVAVKLSSRSHEMISEVTETESTDTTNGSIIIINDTQKQSCAPKATAKQDEGVDSKNL